MATSIEEIKNSEWFNHFLTANGITEDQFLNSKDTQGLIAKFESFMLKIDMDPVIKSPKDFDMVNNPELAERYDEVIKLEHKPEGYHVNDELDQTAYLAAVRSLTCSDDEINAENLQKHIKENSNRIAVSYYSGTWAAVQNQEELQKRAGDKHLDICRDVNDMVQSGKNKEEIYAKLFKNQKPSEDIEKVVTSTIYTQETTPIKDWCAKIGRKTGGILDKIQKFEQDNPHVLLATSLAISSVPGAGRVYSAFRMGLTVTQIYKEAKREGKTFGQVLKDPVKKKQLGMLCARLIPGGRVVIMADAMKNMFSQQYRQNIANNASKTGQAIKNLWKSKGRDKQAWKDLWQHGGKTVAIVGGSVMTAAGAYALADNIDITDTPDISDNTPENPNLPNTTLETKTQEQGEHWTETSKKMWENSTLNQEEQKGNYVEISADEINRQEDVNTNQSSTQETGAKVLDVGVNNLSDSQKHDIDMLFKRDPATANAMINDGKWHSSAELQKMWDSGQISDELKSDMVKFSGERFDDAGHFVNKDGKIDVAMENDAETWQARQDVGRNDENGDSVSNNSKVSVTKSEEINNSVKQVNKEMEKANAEIDNYTQQINDRMKIFSNNAGTDISGPHYSGEPIVTDHPPVYYNEGEDVQYSQDNLAQQEQPIYNSVEAKIKDMSYDEAKATIKDIVVGDRNANIGSLATTLYSHDPEAYALDSAKSMGFEVLHSGTVDGHTFVVADNGFQFTTEDGVTRGITLDENGGLKGYIGMLGHNSEDISSKDFEFVAELAQKYPDTEIGKIAEQQLQFHHTTGVSYRIMGNENNYSYHQTGVPYDNEIFNKLYVDHMKSDEDGFLSNTEINKLENDTRIITGEIKVYEDIQARAASGEELTAAEKGFLEAKKDLVKEYSKDNLKEYSQDNMNQEKQDISRQVGDITYEIEDRKGGFGLKMEGNIEIDKGIQEQVAKAALSQDRDGVLSSTEMFKADTDALILTGHDEIYKDLEARAMRGEELSEGEKNFMKSHEQIRESLETKETYRNGETKSQTDYKGNTATFRRDGSLKSYTPHGEVIHHYNRDGEIQNQDEVLAQRPNIKALRGIGNEDHPKVKVATDGLEKPRPLGNMPVRSSARS